MNGAGLLAEQLIEVGIGEGFFGIGERALAAQFPAHPFHERQGGEGKAPADGDPGHAQLLQFGQRRRGVTGKSAQDVERPVNGFLPK